MQTLALSDVPYVVPPKQPIGSNPGVSSRGTDIEKIEIESQDSQDSQQNLYCRHIFKFIVNHLCRNMKEFIMRLFNTVDFQTCHWSKTTYDVQSDEFSFSLLSPHSFVFHDTFVVRTHNSIQESRDLDCDVADIDHQDANRICIERALGPDSEPSSGYCFCFFLVFHAARLTETEKIVPKILDTAVRAPEGLQIPAESNSLESRQYDNLFKPYWDWCSHVAKVEAQRDSYDNPQFGNYNGSSHHCVRGDCGTEAQRFMLTIVCFSPSD